MLRRVAVLVLGGLASTIAGCQDAMHSGLYPVSGQVMLDGRPLSGGIVVFLPEQGSPAKGVIAADGSFRMGTFNDGDGVMPGNYGVSFIALDRAALSGSDPTHVDARVRSLVPEHYNSSATSGLKFQVNARDDNVANFQLISEPAS